MSVTNKGKCTEAYVKYLAHTLLSKAVGSDYAGQILEYEDGASNTFIESVIEDVVETSAWSDNGFFNEDDVRLAIGRVLKQRLGVQE